MFRVPPSPFIVKKPFSPTGNKPLKTKSRRLSNVSDERTSPVTATARETHDEGIVRESEPEDADAHEWSRLSPIVRDYEKGAANKQTGHTTLSEDDHIVKDSFMATENDNGEEMLVEDSFVQQPGTVPVVTPLSSKRKRHERTSQHEKSSSKHKKARKSNDPPISFDLPNTSSPAVGNDVLSSELPDGETPADDEENHHLSKEERKRERRRRKEERKREKEERKLREGESTNPGIVNPMDHDGDRGESPPVNLIKEVQETQADETPRNGPATSQENSPEIEMDEDSLDLGRPAVSKNRPNDLEIPATQNSRQDSDRPAHNPPDPQPPLIEKPSNNKALTVSLPKETTTKPLPKPTKRKRPPPSKPSPKRTRKISSNEKILDSSASEEEHDSEPKPKPKTPHKRTKTQVVDPDATGNPSANVEQRSTVALGRFSVEEDKRLLRVAKAYRIVHSYRKLS